MLWIAIALSAGAGGAAFATAATSASGDPAGSPAPISMSAVNDPLLVSTDPGDADEAARLATVTGVPAADNSATRTWNVGGVSVLGYTAAGGSFCFEFRKFTGGCLQPDTLTNQQPLGVSADYGPGTFNVYGLALDGVTAVEIDLGGNSYKAALADNAFFFSDSSLGGSGGFSGKVIATMSDGTTRSEPVGASGTQAESAQLP